jgi:hypothetical protein
MSPIDDQLRKAMHARADHLSPAPDPLSGIEDRARRIRRRRSAGAALAGAALAVAAVAFAVPALTAGSSPGRAQVASSATPAPTTTPEVQAGDPANLLTWAPRGSAPPAADVAALKGGFAPAVQTTIDRVHFRALFHTTHHGLTVTVGQAWKDGELAYDVGYTTGGANGVELFIGQQTAMQTPVVALAAAGTAGSTTDLLVLVPRPGTGQVLYSPDATTAFAPVASGRSDIDAIGLVERDRKALQDRVEILDGDGNLDKPLYKGAVALLLCARKECG